MASFIDHLASVSANKSRTKDTVGRAFGLQLGVVVERDEPSQYVRVQLAGSSVVSPWLYRVVDSPAVVCSTPQIGETVLVAFIDGNPNQGVYLGVVLNAAASPDTDAWVKITTKHLESDTDTTVLGANTTEITALTTISGIEAAVIGAVDIAGHPLINSGQ